MESERPELALRTTVRRVRPSRGTWMLTWRSRTGRSEGISRGTGTRSKLSRSTSKPRSVLPSSTTTISWRGWCRERKDSTAERMPISSLCIEVTTLIPGSVREPTSSSRPANGARRRWVAESTAARTTISR